jgi:lipoprotein-releasing system permease protein
VKGAIERYLKPPEYAQTWIDMNSQYFEAIRLERTVMFFLLFFIVIVAAFGIMNTLITVTVQKRREIGIMKALGATVWQIVWVFLGQGMVGRCIRHARWARARHDADPLPQRVQPDTREHVRHRGFPAAGLPVLEIPAQVVPGDVAIVCIGAFVICWVFAAIPRVFRRTA